MVNYILSKSPNGLFLIFERSVQFDFTIRQKDILAANANTGNITYTVYDTLGKAFGTALHLDPNTSLLIGKFFTRAIALSGLMGMTGAFFVLLYSPIKSFIMGSDPRLRLN